MTSSFVVVLPAIDPTLARACLTSMSETMRARTLLIDNTDTGEIADEWATQVVLFVSKERKNIGVARAWNQGVHLAEALDAEYLIIVSQSITFGEAGGEDMLDQLAERRPKHIAHSQHGWHLLAFNREVFDTVGLFDTEFPHYGTDTDYLYRMGLAGLPSPRENGGKLDQIHVDAACMPDGESLRRQLVKFRYGDHLATYERKWHGPQGAEQATHPYGNDTLDWTYVGKPPEEQA